MSWESEPVEKDASRDYGRYLWPAIALVVCLMLAVLWWVSRDTSASQTRARIQVIRILFHPKDNASQSKALTTITQVRRRIVDGESFSKLASEYSDHKVTARRGGNWGWTLKIKDDLLPGMGAFVWKGPIDELSPIIQAGDAYFLIIVIERRLSGSGEYEIEINKRSRDKDAGEQSP